MTGALRKVWVILCCIIFVIYLLSCLTPLISPGSFSFISLFAIAFPYLFVAALFCSLTFFFVKKSIAVIAVLFTFLAGFKNLHSTVAVNAGNWQMHKNDSALRVMTWNTEEFITLTVFKNELSDKRAQMIVAINTYKPDILCVQELKNLENSNMEVSIRKVMDTLGFTYHFFSNDETMTFNNYGLFATRGVGIFSRLPLLDTGRITTISRAKKANMIYADVLFNNRPVRIFTAHLLSFQLYGDTTANENIYKITYHRKRSVQYKIRETEIAHGREVAIIKNAVNKSPYPVIYCGDINATPASYTYHTLKKDLQDAFLEKGSGLGSTFYKLNLRIDVCLAGNQLRVTQCTVPQLYLSDHFPVVTDLEWR